MAKPETTVKLQETKSFTPYSYTYSVEVPVCEKCKNNYFTKVEDKRFNYSFIAGFAGLVAGGIIGALIERTEVFLAICVGAAVGCIICVFIAHEIIKEKYGKPPVEIDVSKSAYQGEAFWINFKNQEYAGLFRKMNNDIHSAFLAGR